MATKEQTVRGRPLATRLLATVLRNSLSVGTRLLNPLTLTLAGSQRLPLLAVIQHRGRRSGRSYATPVGARPTADGFVIPLTFGKRTDWFRNVLAAGGCVIRWNGAEYPVVEPEVVDWATARAACYPVERILMPLIGIEQFVQLRHAPASRNDPT
jgi:deazaflavin-dependent oxidoreductase (nitroreductase family)